MNEIDMVVRELIQKADDMRWNKPSDVFDSRTDKFAKMNRNARVNQLKEQSFHIILGKDNTQNIRYDRYFIWSEKRDA